MGKQNLDRPKCHGDASAAFVRRSGAQKHVLKFEQPERRSNRGFRNVLGCNGDLVVGPLQIDARKHLFVV